MANLCITTFFITGKDDALKQFFELNAEAHRKFDIHDAQYGEKWTKYMSDKLGINPDQYDTNMQIDDIGIFNTNNTNQLFIRTVSPWVTRVKWITACIRKLDPDAKIFFFADESEDGCCLSNDIEHIYFNDYLCDAYIENKTICDDEKLKRFYQYITDDGVFMSKEEVVNNLNSFLQTNLSFDELMDIIDEDYDFDSPHGIVIHFYNIEYVDLDGPELD